MWCDKRVLRSPLLWSVLCLTVSGLLSAGHRPAANSTLAPGCVAGECRPAPARVPAIQGALLQAAALSVVAGPGVSQKGSGQLKDLPRRSKARLPSWYRRAQVAQLRDQTRPAERVGARSAESAAPVRVREKGSAAASSHSREPLRLARASAVSTAATTELPKAGHKSPPRPEARSTRRRRLIEESLEQASGIQEREPRFVDALCPPLSTSRYGSSPIPVGNSNFTSVISQDLTGNYVLVEPVVVDSTDENLPLGNDTHPFEGQLVGTQDNSLRLDLVQDGGDLALFGGLKDARVNLSVHDSTLFNSNGSVALFGGSTERSLLDLTVRNSHLSAQEEGMHAAVVQELRTGNQVRLSMSGSTLTVTRTGTGGDEHDRLAVAGPVAYSGQHCNGMVVHDTRDNRVRATADEGLIAVASLGWGDVQSRSGAPHFHALNQHSLSNNTVQAVSVGGRAHASLAGSYEYARDNILEQKAIAQNTVHAQTTGAGRGLASLGLIHYVSQSQDNSATLRIRQRQCHNNTVKAEEGLLFKETTPVVGLALVTDDRFSAPPADVARVRLLQREVSDNRLSVLSPKGGVGEGASALLGSMHPQNPCDASSRCQLDWLDQLPEDTVQLFLFSGGDSRLPLSSCRNFLRCVHDELRCCGTDECSTDEEPSSVFLSSVVDQATYDFNQTGCGNSPWMVSSTETEGWKRVNQALCKTVPELFDGMSSRCNATQPCHNPGEQFHSLIPGTENAEWLLVTRQTWPAGSQGNRSSVDLFRVLPFSHPVAPDSEPQLQSPANGAGLAYNPAGSVYSGTRVVPEDSGPLQALAVGGANGRLHLVFQDRSSLRWATFPLDEKAQSEKPFESTHWQPPSGGELMLLSNEEDGVNLWIRRKGTVDAWSLEDIRNNKAASRTLPLSSDDDPPLALARDGDFLYSLHNATEAEDTAGQPFRVQRWNLPSNSPDSCWTVNWQDPLPGRLTANNCTLKLEPDNAMPVGDGSIVLKPQVPDGGGCLTWDRMTRSLEQLNLCGSGTACPTSAASSSAMQPSPTVTATADTVTKAPPPVTENDAAASLLLLAPVGAGVGAAVGACAAYKYCRKGGKGHRKPDSDRVKMVNCQEQEDAGDLEDAAVEQPPADPWTFGQAEDLGVSLPATPLAVSRAGSEESLRP